MFFKIGVLKNFANFTGKNCVGGSHGFKFIIKRFQHRCFPVKFVKFLRTPFSAEHLRWLLFNISNNNNLFKDFLEASLTHNKSLITCNSQNNLPKLVPIERFLNRFRTNSFLPEILPKY